MIGLDTNVIVRYVMQDDEKQSRKATRLIEGLLRTREFTVDRAEQVAQALRVYKTGLADFADCLIERGATSAGCENDDV